MPVITGRTLENGYVAIDHERCALCGLCARVCAAGPIEFDGRSVDVDVARGLGCIACGHCAAVCPRGCITVEGRDMTGEDIVAMPPIEARADYDRLQALLLSRRSMREFDESEVEQEAIDRIIDAAATAPMGVPPSDVRILVFAGRDKVREFKRDMIGALASLPRVFSRPMRHLWRPILGREGVEMFRTFLVPLARLILEADKRGEDLLMYDAPLGMLFYGSPYGDTTDGTIAATYATIAAESLGLGSCMLGFPAPLLKRSRRLCAKYGLEPGSRPALMVIFGHPAVRFQRAVKRRFAGVRYR